MSFLESALDYARLIASSPGYRKKGVAVPAGYDPTWSGNKCSDTEFGWEILTDRGDRPLLYFVFPGTESFFDCLFDLMAWKMRLAIPYDTKGKCRVYAGPYLAYQTIRDSIHSIVGAFVANSVDVEIAGHSYNSVLSVMAAVDIQYNYRVAPKVYLTGSPKHGNAAFCQSYNRRVPETYRIETRKDWATRMPPLPGFGFGGIRVEIPGNEHDVMEYISGLTKTIGRNHV